MKFNQEGFDVSLAINSRKEEAVGRKGVDLGKHQSYPQFIQNCKELASRASYSGLYERFLASTIAIR
jgi:hypothetical protein